MKSYRKLTTQWGMLVLAGLVGASQLHATSVLINNPGFEADVLASGGFTNNTLTNWTNIGSTSFRDGVQHPSGGVFNAGFPSGGSNSAYMNPAATNGTSGFYQDVAALVGNSTYTFGVVVGERLDQPLPQYNIQLLDAVTLAVLASGIPADPGSGNHILFNMIFDSANFAASLGHAIRIEFSASSGGPALAQVNFDDVTLSYVSDVGAGVPEPSSLGFGLLGIGLAALARLRLSARKMV